MMEKINKNLLFPIQDSKINTLLFVEPEIGGHQLQYIQYLCDYYANKSFKAFLIFLVHPSFNEVLKRRGKTKEFEFYKKNKIRFISVEKREYKNYTRKNLLVSSLFRWLITKKYADKYNVQHIHFLSLDTLQLPLALKLNIFSPRTVSGIVFRLSIHYRETYNERSLSVRVKNLRKKILYSGLLLNKKVTRVFSLDPYLVDYSKKNMENSEKLCKLPEPGPYYEIRAKNKKENNLMGNGISRKGRKLFLLFGSLRKKKGVIQTLQAINLLEQKHLRESLFVFAGKIEDRLKKEFETSIQRIRLKKNAEIIHFNEFITEAEILALIEVSDCVLVPYQKFIGSSNVLLWAAGAQKPVITQNYGLLGKWTKDNKLGLTTDTSSSKNIAEAIKKIIEGNYNINKESMEKFASKNTPLKYAETVFSEIIQRK